jgi:hypothetical protein
MASTLVTTKVTANTTTCRLVVPGMVVQALASLRNGSGATVPGGVVASTPPVG